MVLQLDVPGVLTSEIDELLQLVDDPPLPVAVWVGPAPAVVHGAAAEMLRLAPIRSAAPGAVVGYRSPLVTGTELSAPDGLANSDQVVIEAPVTGIGGCGRAGALQSARRSRRHRGTVRGETTTLETLGPATGPDGEPLLDEEGPPAETVVAEVRFHQPGPLQRVMRAALAPGVAFFLVAVGLAVAAFEFYAAGPGVAAAVAALCLLVGGYGMVMLPLRWWAVLLLMGGIWLLTAEFQVGRFGRWSLLGGVLLLGWGSLPRRCRASPFALVVGCDHRHPCGRPLLFRGTPHGGAGTVLDADGGSGSPHRTRWCGHHRSGTRWGSRSGRSALVGNLPSRRRHHRRRPGDCHRGTWDGARSRAEKRRRFDRMSVRRMDWEFPGTTGRNFLVSPCGRW